MLLVFFSGCSLVHEHYGEYCKNHAYVQRHLEDYIRSRFQSGAPVRMAVIPFSVPANVAGLNNQIPGLGSELAWKVHARFLETEIVPITEVLNRQDWPGKKEEFFTGNFGAIAMAKEAGYDLAVIGYVEPQNSMDALTAFVKIVEVESGITVYYGKSTANTRRRDIDDFSGYIPGVRVDPSNTYFSVLSETLGRCVVKGVIAEDKL